MGLHGEVFQEQGVHGALEAHVKLADLALGEGDDGNAGEAQMLEQRGDIRLIAGNPVQCLGQHHVEQTAVANLLAGG